LKNLKVLFCVALALAMVTLTHCLPCFRIQLLISEEDCLQSAGTQRLSANIAGNSSCQAVRLPRMV